jgi:mono/diheme cytochrome c family protein
MNKGLARRIAITLALLATPLILGLLLTYQVIHVDWISFMEIQPSFRPMEDPLPVPPRSVPVEGAAFIPDEGSPANPISPDAASMERGKTLYAINCQICHGEKGKGDGSIAEDLERKPADLSSVNVASLSEGEIFLVLTNGVQLGSGRKGGMPDLRENLSVNDRWEVVNYVAAELSQKGFAAISPRAPGACAIRAVDLIGAWVSAKSPEKEAFPFTDITGKACGGTFEGDVLPLFTSANIWYAGALSCRTCHGPDVQISYARLDLSAYQGILAGSGRSSAEANGDDILGGGDWEKSELYKVLNEGEMPPNRPAEVNPRGPIIYAGGSK